MFMYKNVDYIDLY